MMARVLPYPFLKWPGGKSRMIGRIVSHLPDHIATYYEPFLGGGAVFFEMAREKRFVKAVLSDLNPELMNCYRVVKEDVDDLLKALRRPEYVYAKEAYLKVRAVKPSEIGPVERAARFVYLNRTCFNGLYRENLDGEFNVPFGRYENPVIVDEPALRAASEALQSATLACCGFESALSGAVPGDAAYLDPPYLPISKTSSFTAYNKGGFGEEGHRRLASEFTRLWRAGIPVVLSNSSAPLALELYKGFETLKLTGSRSVGGPASYRKPVKEIIVYGKKGKTQCV
jgi:DNA adenine methylase